MEEARAAAGNTVFMNTLLASAVVSLALSPATGVTVVAQPVVPQTIAAGAMRIPLLDIRIQASCALRQPVDLQSLTLRHRGLGELHDLAGVYALSGATRLSRLQTFSGNDHTAVIPLRSVTLTSCQQRTIRIAGDFAPDAAASGEHSLSLVELSTPTGRIVPVADGLGVPARVAPIDTKGPVVDVRPLLVRPSYGSRRTVLRFLLSAQSDALSIQAITLTNDGSARDSDLQSIAIVNAKGETLTNVEKSMQGSTVRLQFSPPLSLERSVQKLLEVRADIRSSRRKTVDLQIQEQSDIEWSEARR